MKTNHLLLTLLVVGATINTGGVSAMELQGHRGARGLLPENSLPGFQYAISAGADCLELDIAMSSDKQLVITHDPALSPDIVRQGDQWVSKRVPVKSLSVQQLKSYDIGRLKPGTRYARRFPKQQPIDGLQMPLLSELLDLPEVKANNQLCLDIEIKTTPIDEDITFAPTVIANALVKLIEKPELRARARIRSFDWRGLMHVKRVAPAVPLAFLTAKRSWLNNLEANRPGKSPWLAGLDIDDFEGSAARAIKHLGGQIWAPYYLDLTQAEVTQAQQLGLKVIVWTVNDATAARRMIKMGVDGITTDYPKLIHKIIAETASE